MITVNPYFLHTLLEPLTGLADDDEAVAKYAYLSAGNEADMRNLIRDLIAPHAASLSPRCLNRVRLAYQYYLTVDNARFDRVFESVLPPFDPPDNPRDFFVWIWEICFPGEEFRMQNANEAVVKADVSEPLSI